MAFPDLPMCFHKSGNFGKFWITRLGITYGSLAGLWYVYGAVVAASAFFGYLAVGGFTHYRGYRAVLLKWARINFQRRRSEAETTGAPFDEHKEWSDACAFGKSVVDKSIERNGQL